MTTIELPDLPGLSGLNNADLVRVLEMGLDALEKRTDCREGRAAVIVSLDPVVFEALCRLAELHKTPAFPYIEGVLHKHAHDWRRHLAPEGLIVPEPPAHG